MTVDQQRRLSASLILLSNLTINPNSNVQSYNQRKRENFQHSCQATAMPTINKFIVSLMILFCILSPLCIINVEAQRSNYLYYSNENNINVKNNDIDQINFHSLIHKDFFSIFSNEITVLNSVESRSTNTGANEKNYATNIESEYLSSYSNNKIPITKFRPAILNFNEQPTTVPKLEKVVIYNIGKDPLVLESISGSTTYFYCSFFSEKIIPPGGNTSFNVYFLARELGLAKSAIYINTNKGIIKYNVQGFGIKNDYNLKPVLKSRISLNMSFTSLIRLHNPHNATMEILEIFTSDDDLHIELIDNSSENTKNDSTELKNSKEINKSAETKPAGDKSCISDSKNWSLKPFVSQTLAKLRYIGRQVNNHTSFICILAALNETDNKIRIIIPIEMEVTKKGGIFSYPENIDFGIVSLPEIYRTDSNEFSKKFSDVSLKNLFHFNVPTNRFDKKYDLFLINNEESPLKITEIYPVRHNPALTILINKDIELIPDNSRIAKVAEIRFNPLKSKRPSDNYGKLLVKTNNKDVTLSVYFSIILQTGGYDHNKQNTIFNIEKDIHVARNIKLINKHSFPVVMHGLTFDSEFTGLNFRIHDFKGPTVLPSHGTIDKPYHFKIIFNSYIKELYESKSNNKPYETSVSETLFMKTMCTVHTNYTDIQIPLYIYDSQLNFVVLNNDSVNRDDLILNPLKINATKEIPIEIDNYNPIDIDLDSLEIISKNKNLKSITNIMTIKFDYFESLSPHCNYDRVYINKTLTNNQIKNQLKIPAHHRMVIILIIQNVHDPKIGNEKIDGNDSILFEYELSIKTKFQVKTKLKIEFFVLNNILELIKIDNNRKNSILEDLKIQSTNLITIKTFPTKISSVQFSIRNNLTHAIQAKSIEFSHFGEAFDFKWLNDSNNRYGFMKANSNSILGVIEVNSHYICIPYCYLGLEPRTHTSIIDRSSLYIDKLSDITPTTDKSLIYDLWLKTFNLKAVDSVKNKLNESVQTFDVDYFLFSLLRKYWSVITDIDTYYYSSIELFLNKSNTELNDKVVSYRFPIDVEFIWPRLISEPTSLIDFQLTQIYSTKLSKNLTIKNPSNSNILFQIVLASNYSNVQKTLQLLDNYSDLFFTPEYELTMKRLLNKSIQNDTGAYFQLKTDQNVNDVRNDVRKQFEYLNIEPDNGNSLIFVVEPNKEINIQIEFLPLKVGKHEDMLIIRNNLTILDIQLISGEVGSAELRVNNLPPMKSSIFYNEIPQTIPGYQTADFSNIVLQMNKDDYEHCQTDNSQQNTEIFDNERFIYANFLEQYSHILTNVYYDESLLPDIQIENKTIDGAEVVLMSQMLSSTNDKTYKSSFKTKEGIVLRGYLVLKNIGTTDLNVLNVVFDGDSCFSRGIEVTYCSPFTIPPYKPEAPLNESIFLLEIRYRPDFTMSLIEKSLILETNIGDLRYDIVVQIPHYMLSVCHDSLPRPPLEGYLFYLGISLVLLLVLVMLLTSMVESRSIIKYQNRIYRQIYALNDAKSWFTEPKSFQPEFNSFQTKPAEQLTKQKLTVTKSKSKNIDKKSSKNNSNQTVSKVSKQQNSEQTNHSHRILTKALSSPRSNRIHLSSDSSVSSCSSSNTNIAKKTSNQLSPKAEKRRNKENAENFELTKTETPQLPEVTVTEPDNNQFKVKAAKTKSNSRPRTPNEIAPLAAPLYSQIGIKKQQNKQPTPAVSSNPTNENVLINRKNFINVQKSQLTVSKSTPNESFRKPAQQAQTTFKPLKMPESDSASRHNQQISQNYNNIKPQSGKTISNLSQVLTTGDLMKNSEIPTLFSSNIALSKMNTQDQLEKLEIELLNNQLQQLQQQNKKQFEDISYLNTSSFLMGSKIGSHESSSSSSPSSSSNSSPISSGQELNTQMIPFPNQNRTMISHLQTQYDLLDMMLNSNRNEQQKVENSNSSLMYGLLEKVNNDGLIQENKRSNEKVHNMNEYYEETSTVAVSAESGDHPPGFSQNPEENLDALSSSSMTDSWIMIDYNGLNPDDDYDRIVNETEEFKKSFFDLDKAPSVSPPLVEQTRNEDLDKLLYSLINTGSQNKEKFLQFPVQKKQNLQSTVSNEEYYSGGFLGPIQRPKAFQTNNSLDFNYDLNMSMPDLKDNDQFESGSNLKLTGEDIAMLSALFANKNQKIANENKSFQQTKQQLSKAKSSDYHDYHLFGNSSQTNSLSNAETKSLLLDNNFSTMGTSSPSYWPESINQKSSIDSSTRNAQPWNSVLLNDFDNFAAPPSLNNSSTGNHIKNLWSTSLKESPSTTSTGTASKKGPEKFKKHKNEKKTL